jgi:seryl-tRNA synthetase
MGQARTRSDPEISLFPFLSILVCVIGALMLLIIVMSIVQGVLGDRRDAEEVARASEADRLRREAEERAREIQQWQGEKEKGDALHAELGTKRERFVVLTQKIEGTEEEKRKIEFEQAAAQKELENMLLQIEMLKSEQGPIRAEIEKLKAQLAARKATLDAKPRLVVRGSGSGAIAAGTPLFFVECNATGIVIHHPAGPQHLSTGSIGLDQNYDDFLRHVASTPKAMVVFLLREDGLASYNRAAGWAESRFAVRHGKLPLPGQGEVDLSLFQAPPPPKTTPP